MFRHFHRSLDAKLLNTPNVQQASDRFGEVVDGNHMTAFYGDVGHGKTSTIRWLLEAQERPFVYMQLPDDPAPSSVTRKLLETLTGVRQRHSLYTMTEELTELLEARRPIVVFDEAQKLRLRAVECLRGLWDADEDHFPLVFVGGQGCWQTLRRHAALKSRLHLSYRFRALSPEDVKRFVPTYHEVYADMDHEIVELVDDSCARGELRIWAKFTLALQRQMERRGVDRADRALVEDTLLRMANEDDHA